jgi:hypothetical protein
MNPEKQLRASLQPEEQLLWIGQPSRRRFYSEMAAHFLFGLIPFSFGTLLLGVNGWVLWQSAFATSEIGGHLLAAAVAFFFLEHRDLLFFHTLHDRGAT